MSNYRLLRHKNYEYSVRRLPEPIRQKATWAQVLLGTRGRTPSVKGTAGQNARWRRTPVQGNHYYMWWIPQSESSLRSDTNGAVNKNGQQSILIHSIRHHDETDIPIQLGALTDYEELPVSLLDPRFEEQRRVSSGLFRRDLSLTTVKGLPGSGKTVSLLYLVKDILQQTSDSQILYVTYTSRLKRAAQEFLQAQDAELTRRVRIRTLNEVMSELTGVVIQLEPYATFQDFNRFLEQQNRATVGPWRRFPQTLYTEIRSHLLGQAFPIGYTFPHAELNGRRFSPGFSAEAYAANRAVDPTSAELAYKLALRAATMRFFREQKAAQQALRQVTGGKVPAWLSKLDALVIDEIQDLTLLQIAFLGELVRMRTRQTARGEAAPFVFTVAGDESQIVQPSGFDWGVTKDLLSQQLGARPNEFEFQHQRRAPRALSQVIDASWNFYGHLPKRHRPSANRLSYIDEAVEAAHRYEESGQILLCANPTDGDQSQTRAQRQRMHNKQWASLLDELIDKPGRIVIDVTETLHSDLPETVRESSDEVLFLPREIKGLERSTVIIHGLNSVYQRAVQLCEDAAGDNIPRFEARRLFDEMRVALSRSTNRLVLLEPATAPVLAALEIATTKSATHAVEWVDLIDTLRTEEMSTLEVIEGYLSEVEDLAERGRWAQAYRRNRRAHELAISLGDQTLQRDADAQVVQVQMLEVEVLYAGERWQEAYALNQKAKETAISHGDPTLLAAVDEQMLKLTSNIRTQAQRLLAQAQQWAEHGSYQLARRDAQAAHDLAVTITAVDDPAIDAAPLLEQVNDTLGDICWQWAYQLTAPESNTSNAKQAAELLADAAEIIAPENAAGSAALRILARRYELVPQIGALSAKQIDAVLGCLQEYLTVMHPLGVEPDAYLFAMRWMDETFETLGNQVGFYYRWAFASDMLASDAIYPNFDDNIWDLENRVAMLVDEGGNAPGRNRRERAELAKFHAFLLGYNGDAAAASVAWEALNDLVAAAKEARAAGQIERAYDLLRRSDETIPDELAVAVKTVRLLDQLTQKQAKLTTREKETLYQRLVDLQDQLAVGGQEKSTTDSFEIELSKQDIGDSQRNSA